VDLQETSAADRQPAVRRRFTGVPCLPESLYYTA